MNILLYVKQNLSLNVIIPIKEKKSNLKAVNPISMLISQQELAMTQLAIKKCYCKLCTTAGTYSLDNHNIIKFITEDLIKRHIAGI